MRSKLIDSCHEREDVFEVVNTFPRDYIVWNIGRQNFPHPCYIPLARLTDNDPYHVQLDCLKALKVKEESLALYVMKRAEKGTVNSVNYISVVKDYNNDIEQRFTVQQILDALKGVKPDTPVFFNYENNLVLRCTSIDDIGRLGHGDYPDEIEFYLQR